MGKGREIAGVLVEQLLHGRTKSLWVSISSDLKIDAERDLRDCGVQLRNEAEGVAAAGGGLQVVALNKCPYGKLKLDDQTVLFTTYASLISKRHKTKGGRLSKAKTRLDQIVEWLGGAEFDGTLIFDECHKSKNLIPSSGGVASKTGAAVVELQKLLPKARVLYCSATGVSEPRNMGYMTRLGLWGEGTPFPSGFKAFLAALERRGVGALELLAMEMKRMGLYVCRTLSYEGANFSTTQDALSDEQRALYDRAAAFVQLLRTELLEREAAVETQAAAAAQVAQQRAEARAQQQTVGGARERGGTVGASSAGSKRKKAAAGLSDSDDSESSWDTEDEKGGLAVGSRQESAAARLLTGRSRWRYFWGQHQRFFMSLCAAMKVPIVVKVTQRALAQHKCVVIGLQSTGEASTKQVIEDKESKDGGSSSGGDKELDDFISAPAIVLERLIIKTFPMLPKPRSLRQRERQEEQLELAARAKRQRTERKRRLGRGLREAARASASNYVDAESDEDDARMVEENGSDEAEGDDDNAADAEYIDLTAAADNSLA